MPAPRHEREIGNKACSQKGPALIVPGRTAVAVEIRVPVVKMQDVHIFDDMNSRYECPR
jgi:hypothetical protein